MKGKILDFSINTSEGVISGDDGNRYTFTGKEWKSSGAPQAGSHVDFDTQERNAIGVYMDAPAVKSTNQSTAQGLEGAGPYRSSDDKMLAGVCAGLAHKWNFNKTGLRVATVVVSAFIGLPILAYIIAWVVLPTQSTKGA